MKRKAIVLMLCVGLTMGILAGCGSKENVASENTETVSEEKSEAESETRGEEESEAAQDNSTEQADAPDETEAEPDTYLVREVAFTSEGREFDRKEYDVNGNVIRTSSGYNGDGTLMGWYIYEYDANGNQVKWGQYDEAGAYSGQVYEYDEYGNRTREFSVRADIEDTTYEKVYQNEYDSDGKLIAREITTSYNGQASTNREEYEYDGAGNLVRDITYTTYGEVLTEYDSFGNVTRDQGPSGGDIYEYDEYGNIIKDISLDANGNPTGDNIEYRNEYDAFGNLIKYSAYDSEGKLHWWEEYEYDARGNLIKTTHTMLLEDNESTTIREYEYASF